MGGIRQVAARIAAFPVGQRLLLEGRVQSRTYIKQLDTGPEERTAYEISALTAEIIDDCL